MSDGSPPSDMSRPVASSAAEREHRALEERYRRVVETSSDAIVITDLDRRIAFANPAAIELFGYGEALVGMPVWETLPEEMRDAVRRYEDLAIEGAPQRYEGSVLRADGERRMVAITSAPLRELGRVTGIVASLRDITEERARSTALARLEERYTRLVESATDSIFTVDLAGRFTSVNRSLERAVGKTRDELLGQPIAVVVDGRDLAAAQGLLRETFLGQRCRGSIRYRSDDDDVRHGSLITSPILEDRAITGALGIMRDVTDDQRLAEQLLQQEKLAAIGQLVSGVAHELNNPLAGVMAYTELLISTSSTIPPAEAREALETIRHEAMRASKIVSHLLTFARQQPSERVEVDLNRIVEDTLTLRRYVIRSAEIDLELQLDRALPRTWADPFQLQQVLLNLLGNAEHALTDWPGTRRMVIRTWYDDGRRRDTAERTIAVGQGGVPTRTERAAGRLMLSVSDSGPGVPPDQQDRIFNPFFTTKPVGQGTGLGLSISDGIVRAHGGRIRLDSHPGEGATFVVELPLTPRPPAAPESAAKA